MMKNSNDTALEKIAAELKREYHRKWRATHREQVKESNRNYWKRKAAQFLGQEIEKEG